jgi:hypothetical protein
MLSAWGVHYEDYRGMKTSLIDLQANDDIESARYSCCISGLPQELMHHLTQKCPLKKT